MREILWSRTRFPTFEPNVVLGLSLLFVAAAFLRGATWLFTGDPSAVSELMLDLSFGRERLGLLLMLGAGVYVAALCSGRHLAVWSAHGLLFAIHFGAGYSIMQAALAYDSATPALIFPVLNMAFHGLVMRKMRPLPPPDVRA